MDAKRGKNPPQSSFRCIFRTPFENNPTKSANLLDILKKQSKYPTTIDNTTEKRIGGVEFETNIKASAAQCTRLHPLRNVTDKFDIRVV